MVENPESSSPSWSLSDWEKQLTIRVGTAYVCRQCGNLVMVTRGGVGVMQLVCCGEPMEKVCAGGRGPEATP